MRSLTSPVYTYTPVVERMTTVLFNSVQFLRAIANLWCGAASLRGKCAFQDPYFNQAIGINYARLRSGRTAFALQAERRDAESRAGTR